jgi:hypothetical protein
MKDDRNHRRLENELRASRPEPRADFARALTDEVRTRKARERTGGRLGLAVAFSGLIVVAVASFGGIGYASSNQPKNHVWIAGKAKTAAAAQYAPTQPSKPASIHKTITPSKVTPKATPKTAGTAAAAAQRPVKVASAQLPFTGLALWVPLAIGLMLVALGLVLRTRGRRRNIGAH